MSSWLTDAEVLTGEGSGLMSPCSPRLMVFPVPVSCGSPRAGQRGRGVGGGSLAGSPSSRETAVGQPEGPGSMGKARELFVLCDKEGKGFITKRDMQRLQGELPLSPEQLESVFESLDRDDNGFLTPVEFNMGLMAGGLMFVEEDSEESPEETEAEEKQVNPGELKFLQILMDLGAGKLFTDQWELCRLWCELQKDRPELLSILEDILVQAVYQLQDSMRERDSLEQALRRRESDHDMVVQSIYEETESRVKEEKEKRLAKESIIQLDRMQLITEELKMKEQELEISLCNQKELDERIQTLYSEQTDIRIQNHQLQSHNMQLQEQLETSRDDLQMAMDQLELLQSNLAEQERMRERRESDHDMVVQSIYEETESRVKEEKRLAQDSIKQLDRMQHIAEEVKMKEQELEILRSNQKELKERIQTLDREQTDIRIQNHQLQSHNIQLQEQLETSREDLQMAMDQLELLQSNLAEQERMRERTVLKVSRNIQKEKDSLQRQLELLRDMNKCLRDEKDAQQSPARVGLNPLRHPVLLSPLLPHVLPQSIIPTHHHHPHRLCASHGSSLWTHPFNHPIKPY